MRKEGKDITHGKVLSWLFTPTAFDYYYLLEVVYECKEASVILNDEVNGAGGRLQGHALPAIKGLSVLVVGFLPYLQGSQPLGPHALRFLQYRILQLYCL